MAGDRHPCDGGDRYRQPTDTGYHARHRRTRCQSLHPDPATDCTRPPRGGWTHPPIGYRFGGMPERDLPAEVDNLHQMVVRLSRLVEISVTLNSTLELQRLLEFLIGSAA